MKIAACLLCKNDLEFDNLTKAVDSLAPWVDDIFITTTHKDDSKVKIYCEHKKRIRAAYKYTHDTCIPKYELKRYFMSNNK